jgi:hypothetical protein
MKAMGHSPTARQIIKLKIKKRTGCYRRDLNVLNNPFACIYHGNLLHTWNLSHSTCLFGGFVSESSASGV